MKKKGKENAESSSVFPLLRFSSEQLVGQVLDELGIDMANKMPGK